MSNLDVIRAWKDEEYRNSLSAEARAMLPDNPAGPIVLSDAELADVSGASTEIIASLGCCHGFTTDTCVSWQYHSCCTLCLITAAWC
jgi:mersacidin/lichenicidin family type 2 lantibiotic